MVPRPDNINLIQSVILDANRDGVFTISDIWINIKIIAENIFFLPGNYELYLFIKYMRTMAVFLEINHFYYYSWISGVLSFCSWVMVLGLSIGLYLELVDFVIDNYTYVFIFPMIIIMLFLILILFM